MVTEWVTLIVSLIAGVWAFIDVARTKGDTYGNGGYPFPTYKSTAYILAPLANMLAVLFLRHFLVWILLLFVIAFKIP
jgi:hypothetical protein